MTSQYWWPEVFQTGMLDVSANDPNGRAKACADGLRGWANCMAQADIPVNFGKGMAAIGVFLNITPTPKNLSEYGNQFLGKDDAQAVPAPQSQPEAAETPAAPLCDCPDDCRHIPCGRCGKKTVFDGTYGDLCGSCCRADNE